MMQRILAACGGFLLAVLWLDLMFDIQVLGLAASEPIPEPILVSIAGYYKRVTTDAFPMNRLIAATMLTTVIGSSVPLFRGSVSPAIGGLAVFSCAAPTVLALSRVVPNAIRLGTRADSVVVQSDLARTICYDHLLCFLAISVFVALQLRETKPPAKGG